MALGKNNCLEKYKRLRGLYDRQIEITDEYRGNISSLENSNDKIKQGIKDHISQLIDGGTKKDSLTIISLQGLLKQ